MDAPLKGTIDNIYQDVMDEYGYIFSKNKMLGFDKSATSSTDGKLLSKSRFSYVDTTILNMADEYPNMAYIIKKHMENGAVFAEPMKALINLTKIYDGEDIPREWLKEAIASNATYAQNFSRKEPLKPQVEITDEIFNNAIKEYGISFDKKGELEEGRKQMILDSLYKKPGIQNIVSKFLNVGAYLVLKTCLL